jgi:opacity protein-like surface antigen
MAAIYSNGGNRWNILGFNFTKRDALSSVYKISMGTTLTPQLFKNSNDTREKLRLNFHSLSVNASELLEYGRNSILIYVRVKNN